MFFFYGPKCDECNSKLQDYDDASFFFKKTRFVTVNCHKEDMLCKRMSVVTLPAIKYLTFNPENHINYRGSYTLKSIVNFTEQVSKEKPEYQRANPKSINKFNINDYTDQKCLVSAFYTPQSISSLPFFPVVRNMTRVFENENNITISTINCLESPTLCEGFPISSLPAFALYQNGKFLKLNGSSLEGTVEDINNHCGTTKLVNGFKKRKSCVSYFNQRIRSKNKNTEGPEECVEIYNLDKELLQIKPQLKQILKQRNASQDLLDIAYSKLCAIEELDSVIDSILDEEEKNI